jgi:ABC-2 type transport system ATP-binding protein
LGLDPTQMVEIRRLIRSLAKHSTILFSTHILSEVEALCDRVLIIISGEVRADARLSELAATPDAVLVLQSAPSGARKALRALAGVKDVEQTKTSEGYAAFRIAGQEADGADLCPAVFELAKDKGWPVRELRPDVRTLEAVFNELATAA